MKSSIGFLRAFFGSCSGTAIFTQLKDNSWWRIIWHTILLSILAGGIVTGFEMHRFAPEQMRLEQTFRTAFGDRISFSDDRVVPVDAPEKNRSVLLFPDTMLLYVGTGESGIAFPEKDLALIQNFIIWSASDFASARQIAPGEWLFGKCTLHDGKTTSSGNMEQISSAELVQKMGKFHQRKWFGLPQDDEDSQSVIRVHSLGKIAAWMTGISLLLYHFAEYLLSQWFLTTIYAGVFALINARRLRQLTLRQYWKIGIYSGFPALAVGICWPALNLPFLDFRLVYMIGLVFYWMAVAGRLERRTDTSENNHGGTSNEL